MNIMTYNQTNAQHNLRPDSNCSDTIGKADVQKTSPFSTALSATCTDFNEDPAELLQAAMQNITEDMQELPFYRSDIPCFCPPFILFEGQWIGTVLTPWTLSLVILPGPEQEWDMREIGEKIALQLPYRTFTFTVSGIEQIPQYLSCSLLSPLDPQLSGEQAIQLSKDCLRMVLSLPTRQNTPNLSRRNIFHAMLK